MTRALVQQSVKHLVGQRCYSKATRRLGHVDRAWITSMNNLYLAVIFDDGESHQGHANEFFATRAEPLTPGDFQWLNKLGITAWNPSEY